MYLLSLYSEPEGLFNKVEFKPGMNIIYGKKETSNPKESLNSIGKSTFLDLLDFCLLASHLKGHNQRLFAAKDILKGFKICLEFTIKEIKYKIKRDFEDPLYIEFWEESTNSIYHIDDLKKKLGELVFYREGYSGVFNGSWFRTLITFYLKIQKFKRERFHDPIKFVKEASEVELTQYVLYLMGFNNTLANENFKVYTDLKNIQPAITEVSEFITQKYDIKNLSEMSNEISKLFLECKKLDQAIATFKLGEQYVDSENQANEITGKIKNLLYENFADKKKVDSYNESFLIKESINTKRIRDLYQELNDDFAIQLKKTIDEAVKFRKKLSVSRQSFLTKEINKLQEGIAKRNAQIEILEEERAYIFRFLAAKEAITDLTEAFYNLSEKRNKLSELETNSEILSDLSTRKAELGEELKRIEKEIIVFLREVKNDIEEFYETFRSVFDSIYVRTNDKSKFSITYDSNKKSFINISVTLPDMYGKGKNQGRVLIFDLAVLINSLKFSISFPRFLIHDGVFDGVDKAHFIKTYEFIEDLVSKGTNIQYITTYNEEGVLPNTFGNIESIRSEKIEEEAILVLSPSNKLFGMDFEGND